MGGDQNLLKALKRLGENSAEIIRRLAAKSFESGKQLRRSQTVKVLDEIKIAHAKGRIDALAGPPIRPSTVANQPGAFGQFNHFSMAKFLKI